MEFEYNGNLEEQERVDLVAKEIVEFYPEIDFNDAKIIAYLEDPITTSFDNAMYFKRLYNILFVLHNDKKIFNKVLQELNKTYNLIINDSKISEPIIDSIMNEINDYIRGERAKFPLISEFYK